MPNQGTPLAHDLKNLITPISSFIVHTGGKLGSGAEIEVHAAAQRSVRLMTDYVREALFFSNKLTPRFERTDVPALLESVREFTAPRATERGVKVAIAPGGPVSLTADTVLIQRLLGNLVLNAIDASESRGQVTIACPAPSPGRVRLEVTDRGCGIQPENAGRIFEPYFTTKQFGDDVRGFGLGPAICERIVSLHAGTIQVRSEPGRGTTMMVDLPAAPPTLGSLSAEPLPT